MCLRVVMRQNSGSRETDTINKAPRSDGTQQRINLEADSAATTHVQYDDHDNDDDDVDDMLASDDSVLDQRHSNAANYFKRALLAEAADSDDIRSLRVDVRSHLNKERRPFQVLAEWDTSESGADPSGWTSAAISTRSGDPSRCCRRWNTSESGADPSGWTSAAISTTRNGGPSRGSNTSESRADPSG
ncbi:hypothetical protein CYMTET_43140 [Cymbomonas tetramitiformis]|uniref:Uncharacterized protein n=1 Tax=Cymbomonas tetramitiformis TaxID=36881 RepID=A0AAE0F0K1_9CHLO|nr:hypothetical protein CYMTET_43140 [Cymbomonas tetramitiformis]